jgi:hypothetical protein
MEVDVPMEPERMDVEESYQHKISRICPEIEVDSEFWKEAMKNIGLLVAQAWSLDLQSPDLDVPSKLFMSQIRSASVGKALTISKLLKAIFIKSLKGQLTGLPDKLPDMELTSIKPQGPLRFRYPGRNRRSKEGERKMKVVVDRDATVKNDDETRADVKFFLVMGLIIHLSDYVITYLS